MAPATTRSQPPQLEFWFEFASTYSYPAALRMERLAAEAGVAVRWRAFLLGPIFAGQGWRDSPFNIFPAKGRYMWRDLERICAREGLALRRPSVFPRSGLMAARIATANEAEPWLAEFVRRVYIANFAEDRDIASADVLRDCLETAGAADPGSALESADTAAAKDALRTTTARAAELGIFGAPSFTVAGELFWGNDRLAEALQAASAAWSGA